MKRKRALKAKMRQRERMARTRTIIAVRQMVEVIVWANKRMTQAILEAAKWAAQVIREAPEKTI
jgi:20S proteasome alpha/beta subunit